MNLTDSFIQVLNNVSSSSVSDQTLHQIKRCLLDYIGVTFAGRKKMGNQLDSLILSGEKGTCSILGTHIHRNIYTALIANGFAAHILELDDGNRVGAPHLEASVITVMLALAQKESISYEAFLKGILIGYESIIRLSTAVQPNHKMKGFHSTGTCGTIGIACAIGYALGFNQEQIKCTLSAAVSSASGLLQVLDDGAQLKPYNVANALVGGAMAASVGKCGFAYPSDAIGGARGFLKVFSDQYKKECLIEDKDELAIMQIYVKPYAACRHSHAAIDCALRICEKHKINASDIKDIEVQIYKLAIYGHDQVEIANENVAKMSIPYGVAAAIVLGTCGLEAFNEEALSNEKILDVVQKVRLVENNRLSKEYPSKRGSIVKITLINDYSYECEVEYPLGEPENPISDSQLELKYDSLMQYAGIGQQISEKIKNMIWNLEKYYADLMFMLTESVISENEKYF